MEESRHEAITRVLALAIVAILLSIFAATIASSVETRPFSDSQSAASGVLAAADPTDVTDNPESDSGGKCAGVPTTINYACYQEGNVSEIEKIQQLCSPGFEYTVNEIKGDITVTPKPIESAASCIPSKTPPVCKTGGKPAIASKSSGACSVIYCVGVELEGAGGAKAGCYPVVPGKDKEIGDIAAETRPGAIGNLLTQLEASQLKPALDQLGIPPGSSIIDEAFKSAGQEVEAQVNKNNDTIKQLQDIINGCGPTSVGSPACAASKISEYTLEQKRLYEQNVALRERMDALAVEAKRLAPEVPTEPPGGPVPAPGPVPSPGPVPGPSSYPPSTFPPPGGQQGGSPLDSLLQKLLGGQQGQQGGQQPGSCQQGTACKNSSMYSRDTQCTETKIQECEFGCADDGKTCAPKSNPDKCKNEPKKPDANKCDDGSWRAEKNSKGCIVDWECEPDDDNATKPTAQISCQPLIVDVGMTVAVTYGCSNGVSEGDGFDTGGSKSGSATVALSDPAAGSDKVFFGVTCTEDNLSDFETCEVQVGKPGIVLIANPQAVGTDATTQIGWTTSGMSSCTISSPDQPDFTSRNANTTTVSGTAETDPVSGPIEVVLTCTTVGGQTREASTTVTVDDSQGVE